MASTKHARVVSGFLRRQGEIHEQYGFLSTLLLCFITSVRWHGRFKSAVEPSTFAGMILIDSFT
jgi:hypothetical protein